MPIIQDICRENGLRWAIWRIDENIEEMLLISRNAHYRRKEVENIKHERRKVEFLATRLILDYLLGRDYEVAYLNTGKPYLVDQRFQISISHTKDYAAVGIHPNQVLGIDIEYVSDRVIKVERMFLNLMERSQINRANHINHLLILWSAKESVYKALGCEGVDFSEHIISEKFSPEMNGHFSIREIFTPQQKVYNIDYEVTKDYIITLAF